MRNRTAAQIQKENLYGVGEVRLFSVGFQQFIYNISKKRDAKKLNRVFSHPLFVYIIICLISGFDSLCDIVCFGIFPIILGYQLGMCKIYSLMILAFYGVAGVIRLAYFNVMEEKRQSETSENRKYYQGLPITSMSVIMPLLFMVSVFFPGFRYFLGCLHFAMLLVGFLFILDFRFRKPTNRELVILVAVVAVAVLFILLYKEGWWAKYNLYRIQKLKGA